MGLTQMLMLDDDDGGGFPILYVPSVHDLELANLELSSIYLFFS